MCVCFSSNDDIKLLEWQLLYSLALRNSVWRSFTNPKVHREWIDTEPVAVVLPCAERIFTNFMMLSSISQNDFKVRSGVVML